MPSFRSNNDDDECGASVGIGGWRSCTNPSCSCNSKHNNDNNYIDNVEYKPVYEYIPKQIKTTTLKYYTVVKMTEKAYLINVNNFEFWVPKSTCSITSEGISISNYVNGLDKAKIEDYKIKHHNSLVESLTNTFKECIDNGLSKEQLIKLLQQI